MAPDAEQTKRYALSFTNGGLLVREAIIVVPLYLKERDWARVRDRISTENLLQARTASSGLRSAREVVQRLSVLSIDELGLLDCASPTERGYLMWVAACRRYDLIGEFAEEVVRERFLLLTLSLGYDEFDSFVRGKALWHPELSELKESTMRRLRSTIFRMLTTAGLLSHGEIVRVLLSDSVRKVLDTRSPSDVRFFPTHAGTGSHL